MSKNNKFKLNYYIKNFQAWKTWWANRTTVRSVCTGRPRPDRCRRTATTSGTASCRRGVPRDVDLSRSKRPKPATTTSKPATTPNPSPPTSKGWGWPPPTRSKSNRWRTRPRGRTDPRATTRTRTSSWYRPKDVSGYLYKCNGRALIMKLIMTRSLK